MTEQTRTSVTFTYDTVNGNILQNVQNGDKIHFRALGIIQPNDGSINYDKTQILNSHGISPHIEYKGHSGTDIFINSNEHSGVASHTVNKNIIIDYYLTVIIKDNKEYDFSNNIVFTRLDYGDIRYKDFKLKLTKDDINQLNDENFIKDITGKKSKKGKETQQLPHGRNVNVVGVKGPPENSDEKKKPTNYLVPKSNPTESEPTLTLTTERKERQNKVAKRKQKLLSLNINRGGNNRTIKKK